MDIKASTASKPSVAAAMIFLSLLFILTVPLLLCQATSLDTTSYDVDVVTLQKGGVAYRDFVDTNLPGMIWLQLILRAVIGWRSEPFLAVDCLVVGAIIFLLAWWLEMQGMKRAYCILTASIMYLFYSSTPEVCHGQRDVWMLLPALVALHLRFRQLTHISRGDYSQSLLKVAVLEGTLWGAGIWIKPHVLIPAGVTWCWGAMMVATSRAALWWLMFDVFAVGVGLCLSVIAGVGLLAWSGSLAPFLDVLSSVSAGYAHNVAQLHLLYRFIRLLRFFPWSVVGVAAILLALGLLIRAARDKKADSASPIEGKSLSQVLLSAFFLGWYAQSLVQFVHPYVVVPVMLLGVAIFAAYPWPGRGVRVREGVCVGFVLFALQQHPLLRWERLRLWSDCVRYGTTAEVRDALTVVRSTAVPNWVNLELIAAYLRRERINDRELCCFSHQGVPLFLMLQIRPATPYVFFGSSESSNITNERLLEQLRVSPTRFLVTDLYSAGVQQSPRIDDEFRPCLPDDFPSHLRGVFPWSEPVLYRAGRYVVHRFSAQVPDSIRSTSPSPG